MIRNGSAEDLLEQITEVTNNYMKQGCDIVEVEASYVINTESSEPISSPHIKVKIIKYYE